MDREFQGVRRSAILKKDVRAGRGTDWGMKHKVDWEWRRKEEPGGAVGVNSCVTGKPTEGLKSLSRSPYREGVLQDEAHWSQSSTQEQYDHSKARNKHVAHSQNYSVINYSTHKHATADTYELAYFILFKNIVFNKNEHFSITAKINDSIVIMII